MSAVAAASPVLALDATGDACAVGLLLPDGSTPSRREAMQRGHAERLFPLIAAVLRDAAVSPSDIGVFAAARGPGSFTGVRVGVAAVRAFAIATGARVCGVDGFGAIAVAAHAAGLRAERAAILFGKPPRILYRAFRLDEAAATPLGSPLTFEADGVDSGLDASVALGPGAPAAAGALSDAGWRGRVETRFAEVDVNWIARLASRTPPEAAWALGPPTPLYLRPPDAAPSQEPRPSRLGPRAAR